MSVQVLHSTRIGSIVTQILTVKRKAPGFRGVLKELAWPLVAGIVTLECEIRKYDLINSMHPKKMRSPRVVSSEEIRS